MEETNHHRKASISNGTSDRNVDPDQHRSAPGNNSLGKANVKAELGTSSSIIEEGRHDELRSKKSLYTKLKVFDKQDLRYPNQLKAMILRPLIFLSFPVISYAGFSYGSNLIWFNVLNGTTSLVLSEEPYRFSSSIIGLAYLSPLIG